jgi:hypothetical protein
MNYILKLKTKWVTVYQGSYTLVELEPAGKIYFIFLNLIIPQKIINAMPIFRIFDFFNLHNYIYHRKYDRYNNHKG